MLAAIPKLLPSDREERQKGLAVIRKILSASGEIAGEAAERLTMIEHLFDLDNVKGTSANTLRFAAAGRRAKAS